MKIDDRVVKNSKTWKESEFDSWGAGIGIGIVVEVFTDGSVDVKWHAGRAYQDSKELSPGPNVYRLIVNMGSNGVYLLEDDEMESYNEILMMAFKGNFNILAHKIPDYYKNVKKIKETIVAFNEITLVNVWR